MRLKIDQLRTIPLFSDLNDGELQLILDSSHIVTYPPRNIIFHEGDPGGCLYIVLAGGVRIVLLGEQGKQIILGNVGHNDFFGVFSLLDGGPRCSTAISLHKTTLFQLSKERFQRLLQQHPDIAVKVLFRVGSWLREADQQIKSMGLKDIYGRIVYGLLKFSHHDGLSKDGQIVIEPKPTIQELADRIGSSRETVSRAMKVLKSDHYLRDEGSSYILEPRILSLYSLVTKDFKPSCSALAS